MGGPLVLHRILFLFLNGLLAYRIANRLLVEFHKTNKESTELKYDLDWRDVNLKEPPPLQSSMAERMRLNELLAVKGYDCKEKLQLGDKYEKYVLCGEFGPFKSAASISGDKGASGDLEKQISAQNWIIFTPEGSQIVDKLSGDVEVNYFTELGEWDHWHTWDLEQVLKGRRLDVAKFELYSSHFHSEDQPDVIRKLIPLTKVKQLLLTIETGSGEAIVWKWYGLLYWLFFEQGYVVVGAIPNGVCGAIPRNCRYRVSLAKVSPEQIKSAPVFGMGSPLEERRRLAHFIQKNRTTCNTIASKLPSFCQWNTQSKDTVVLVQYSEWDRNDLPNELEPLEKIHLVSPIAPRFSSSEKAQVFRDSKGVHHLPWTLSSLNTSDNHNWTLKSLGEVLSAVDGHIDLLLLDISGAEWELLSQLLSIAPHVQQISIRGRLFPEENENYRLFYWQLTRLAELGFEQKQGSYSDPEYSLIFKQK